MDGVRGGGISFETGMQAVLAFESNHPPPLEIIDYNGAYGCNMAFRAAAINDMRFDENLPLHGWQEDIDFSNRLAHRGRLVKTNAFVGVHRGVNKGRSPGVPLGFAQIVNPAYLVKKGAITPKKARQLMLRCFVANHLKSFRPEPEIDRRGRLRGQLVRDFPLTAGPLRPDDHPDPQIDPHERMA